MDYLTSMQVNMNATIFMKNCLGFICYRMTLKLENLNLNLNLTGII